MTAAERDWAIQYARIGNERSDRGAMPPVGNDPATASRQPRDDVSREYLPTSGVVVPD